MENVIIELLSAIDSNSDVIGDSVLTGVGDYTVWRFHRESQDCGYSGKAFLAHTCITSQQTKRQHI